MKDINISMFAPAIHSKFKAECFCKLENKSVFKLFQNETISNFVFSIRLTFQPSPETIEMPDHLSKAVLRHRRRRTPAAMAQRAEAKKARKEEAKLLAAASGKDEKLDNQNGTTEVKDKESAFRFHFDSLLEETMSKKKSAKVSVNDVTGLMKSLEAWKSDVDMDQWKELIEEAKEENEGELKSIIAIEKAGRKYLEWKLQRVGEDAPAGESRS